MKSPDMSFNIIRLLLEAWLYVKDSNVKNDYRIPKVTIKLLILSYASSHDNIGVKNATNYLKKKKERLTREFLIFVNFTTVARAYHDVK